MKPAIDGGKSLWLEDATEEFAEFLSDVEQPEVPALSAAAQQIYEALMPRTAAQLGLGRAATRELDERLRKGLRYTDAKNNERGWREIEAARALENRARAELDRFSTDFPKKALERERADDVVRDALNDDAGVVKYLEKWKRRVAQLQAASPERWKVPALSEEELRDEFEVLLLAKVRAAQATNARPLENYEAPGQEATFRFLAQEKDALRRRRAIFLVPRKLRARRDGATTVSMRSGDALTVRMETELMERVRTPEDQLARLEVASRTKDVLQNIDVRLSSIQRKWWNAMRSSFGEDAERLNLQAVADTVGEGKARSTASRMRAVIRDRLTEIGAAELVED